MLDAIKILYIMYKPRMPAQKQLTKRQLDVLKRHRAHHTVRHMSMMKREMRSGKTFKQAHDIALKKVGK